jgi:hypothetical protein
MSLDIKPNLTTMNPWEKYQYFMGQYGHQPASTQMYDTAAPTTAPQSPMGTSPLVQMAVTNALSGSGAAGGASLAGSPGIVSSGILNSTAPSYMSGFGLSPTAGAAPAASPGVMGLSTLGTLPGALGAIGAGAYASNIYEGGGKDIIRGKGKSDDYTNLMLDVNPVTAPINMALRLFGAPSVGRMLFKPSIKEQSKARWASLGNSTTSQPTLNFVDQYRKYLDSDQQKIDGSGANTFGAKKAAGTLKAEDVWGGHGLFKTFGDDWLGKYSEDQRRAVSNALLAKNLLTSSKGDIAVTDSAAAKSTADEAIKAMAPKPKAKK